MNCKKVLADHIKPLPVTDAAGGVGGGDGLLFWMGSRSQMTDDLHLLRKVSLHGGGNFS